MPTFDPKKPHGTIFGDELGRLYEQDGHFFMGDGSLWSPAGEGATDAPAKEKKGSAAKADKPSAVDAELAAQLGQVG